MSATKDVTKVDEKFKNKKHANQNKNQNPKQKNQPGQTPAKNQQPQKQQKKKFPENGGRMNVQNPLVVKRMNFLYQASNLISQIENKDSAKQKDANTLSRFYTQEMKKMSRKLVSRLAPDVKRTICKYCNNYLIPGKTASFRVRSSKPKKVKNTITNQNETHDATTAKDEMEDKTKTEKQQPKKLWVEITCHVCKKKKKVGLGTSQE